MRDTLIRRKIRNAHLYACADWVLATIIGISLAIGALDYFDVLVK